VLRKVFLIEPASRASIAYLKKAVRFFSSKKIAVQCCCRDQFCEGRLHHSYLSAPDKVRFEALVKAFKSDADLVVCLRGGYGSVRLLKRIKKPINSKFLLGFSDVSALQLSGKIKKQHPWILGMAKNSTKLGNSQIHFSSETFLFEAKKSTQISSKGYCLKFVDFMFIVRHSLPRKSRE